ADGAAMKSLKGWNRGEPVIPEYVTMTVGVVDVSTVNQIIDEKLVHRLELFTGITSSKPGDKVSVEHLIRLINHADGLFRNSRGRKVLYLNKVEGQSALLTASRIRDNFDGIVVAGSILEKVWFA
ncbi:MAG: selenium cofactor biosynthesis protein YqeC, partial [Desulforhopalus sp.]